MTLKCASTCFFWLCKLRVAGERPRSNGPVEIRTRTPYLLPQTKPIYTQADSGCQLASPPGGTATRGFYSGGGDSKAPIEVSSACGPGNATYLPSPCFRTLRLQTSRAAGTANDSHSVNVVAGFAFVAVGGADKAFWSWGHFLFLVGGLLVQGSAFFVGVL